MQVGEGSNNSAYQNDQNVEESKSSQKASLI